MDTKSQAELRRQKILANAKERMRKIRRFTLEDVEKEPESEDSALKSESPIKFPEAENEKNVTPLLSNDSESTPKPLVNGVLCNGLNHKKDVEFPYDEHLNFVNTEADSHSQPNVGSMFTSPQKTKNIVNFDVIVFLVLGFSIRFIFFAGFSAMFLDNILGPFLMVCLPRMILYVWQNPEVSTIYSLIIFMGIQDSRVKLPLKILSCLRTAVQYFALYLFSFFVTHCIIKELKF